MRSYSNPNLMNQDVFSLIKAIKENLAPSDLASGVVPATIQENIKQIKELCDSQYSDQSYYGSTALNRKMLLNKRFSELLTPETLKYIFMLDLWADRKGMITMDGRTRTFNSMPTHPLAIYRNSTGHISMADAILFGFSDGLKAVKFMTNNEHNYSPELYKQQREQFDTHTATIVQNLNTLATELGLNAEAHLTTAKTGPLQLLARFKHVAKVIAKIKEEGKNNTLLYVPGYSPGSMRSQTASGLNTVLSIISKEPQGAPTSLDDLAERFIRNEKALLEGWVIHGFYDRAHMEAGLEQDTTFRIGSANYTYSEILESMITKCEAKLTDPSLKIAIEQFDVRLHLVENDLKNRFPSECSAVIAQNNVPSGGQSGVAQQDDTIQKGKDLAIQGLSTAIQDMYNYGLSLKKSGSSKGEVIIKLSEKLKSDTSDFLKSPASAAEFNDFHAKFLKTLGSKNKELSRYRANLSTIATNIGIALTVVGLFFIAAKLITSKITENRALFFAQKSKTTSEDKVAQIANSLSSVAQAFK